LAMNSLLYPESDSKTSLKDRMHAVSSHPIYNFLHSYYRYSSAELKLYSPGINIVRLNFSICYTTCLTIVFKMISNWKILHKSTWKDIYRTTSCISMAKAGAFIHILTKMTHSN
jgi:hypothetical protein